jgi:DNA-binding NtrC family response regulator
MFWDKWAEFSHQANFCIHLVMDESRPVSSVLSRAKFPPCIHARILVAEDDHVLIDILCIILKCQGFDARPAYSAQQALTIYSEFRPHAAILEAWFWNGMNGLELATVFRREHPECKLFVWTAWQTAVRPLLSQYRDRGFDLTVWAKPMHPHDIMLKLADLLIPGKPFQA